MDRALLIRAETIFHDLVGLARESRAAQLDKHCEGDHQLRLLVERLLASDDSGMGGFLQVPLLFPINDLPPKEASKGPTTIGDYEIIRCIGEGGMGVVYEARQANPRRKVALKVLRSLLPSSETLSRFRHEAHILAQLRHPGIAHIYEAAVAQVCRAGGVQAEQPFFAMELVEGLPLRKYVENQKLDIRQRLELMTLVCDAVQHAHEKGVIHRDLKSENILIEASGRPRILDFGVARLVGSDDEPRTLATRGGGIVGTLAYMSPEQVGGDSTQVDTRSDVYSLGVILYDLLTGRLPHNLSGLALVDAAKCIRDVEPPPPSTYNARLRGEVDWIVIKCIEKDRSRRYHSAIALAEDIQRHLGDEPVLAGAPTRRYRFQKLVRRNRGVVAAGVAIFAILVIAVIGIGYGLIQTRVQRDIAHQARADAEREGKTAQAVTSFLTRDLLGSIDQNLPPADRDEKISDVLTRAEAKMDSGALIDEPKTEAAVREVIGHLQFQLGRLDNAERHSRAALELYRKTAPPDDPKIVEALINLGEVMHTRGELLESESLLREAIDLGVRHHTLAGARAVFARGNYAELLRTRGDLAGAEAQFREALAVPVGESSEASNFRGGLLSNFAELQRQKGDLDGALVTNERALEALHAAFGVEHHAIAMALSNRGLCFKLRGDLGSAEPLYRQSLTMRRKLLPENHPDIAMSLNNLASLMRDRGEFAEAEPLYREALAILEKSLPPGHFYHALYRRNLGNCLARLKRYEEAEREIQSAYDQLSAIKGLPPEHLRVTIEAFLKLYDAWAAADPTAGAKPKSTEWLAKLETWKATTQPSK